MSHKLGLIVPYRDRPNQLRTFRNHIQDFLKLDYELIVVEQSDREDFNRGKLLNIGFLKAEELGCDYVVFHDIDMLPIKADYSYESKPTHLITEFDLPEDVSRTLFDEYFGGVTLFPCNIFRQINGYSNTYDGWGFEDDDLLLRCRENHINLDTKIVSQRGRVDRALEFNGKDSYVVVPNVINSLKDFTVYTSFTVNDTPTNMEEIIDEYSIWSIPGFDTTVTYNSFGNFSFQFWKKNLDSISIPSINLPKGTYNCIVTICNTVAPREINFYINGDKVGSNTYDDLYKVQKSKYMFLGAGNPEREKKPNWFKGSIDTFCVFDKILDKNEIFNLSGNINKSLFEFFNRNDMKIYYDLKFINQNMVLDLSGNENNGYTKNTEFTTTSLTFDTKLPIPHRKKGKFKVLPHDENGYKDGYWVSWKSRENQQVYLEKAKNNRTNYEKDGLTNCRHRELDYINVKNYHHIIAKI